MQVSTLDAELAGRRPALVKIDVEGAELDVLRGGRALLADARPLVVFEHVASAARLYGASSGEIWELLGSLGYRVFAATGEGPFDRAEEAVVNWLAVPNG